MKLREKASEMLDNGKQAMASVAAIGQMIYAIFAMTLAIFAMTAALLLRVGRNAS